ncbi:flavin reductase family protein [Tengunoibacter tsumagoiensis]|uniref:Flavin reductase n=1 Tax=Tengunoibacter tsumagoiensis TaxID=2014871 RepID=A0A402A0P2_9CHLR|nr:flavin reductase family protein [Tengunoibacter tsumagoiensis]GCE12683.1 flavin reductase [Tengunoibacter tsumagoiensis]
MDTALKKQALRMLTYGLYIVMCQDGREVNAFTANWLTQISFEPPLLAISIENDAKSLPMILHSRHLTVNILRTGERELAGRLGKSGFKHPEKLLGIPYHIIDATYPILQEALSWVACEVRESLPTGDSTLVIVEVVNAGVQAEGQPLTMNEAGFKHAG